MKCIINPTTEQITRVSDTVAAIRVKAGTHLFINKQSWREKTRDIGAAAPEPEVTPEEGEEKVRTPQVRRRRKDRRKSNPGGKKK